MYIRVIFGVLTVHPQARAAQGLDQDEFDLGRTLGGTFGPARGQDDATRQQPRYRSGKRSTFEQRLGLEVCE